MAPGFVRGLRRLGLTAQANQVLKILQMRRFFGILIQPSGELFPVIFEMIEAGMTRSLSLLAEFWFLKFRLRNGILVHDSIRRDRKTRNF